MPLGAPPYGDDVPSGLRGRPYLVADQPRSALGGPTGATGPARPARQPLYEPGYDGPPRFEGAPRGHGDVPQDELSSYPYGPPGRRPPAAAPYPDDYSDRAGSGGRTGPRPGRPESARPRAAIAAPTQNPQNTQLPQSPRGAGARGPCQHSGPVRSLSWARGRRPGLTPGRCRGPIPARFRGSVTGRCPVMARVPCRARVRDPCRVPVRDPCRVPTRVPCYGWARGRCPARHRADAAARYRPDSAGR